LVFLLCCHGPSSIGDGGAGGGVDMADGWGGGGGDGGTPEFGDLSAPVCTFTAPTACPTPMPTYANDVAPIIGRHCLECHDGRGEPWPLVDYQHVSDWRDTIHDDMIVCAMPPRGASTGMDAEERITILAWLLCGLPK
jgi:hypothetical protein